MQRTVSVSLALTGLLCAASSAGTYHVDGKSRAAADTNPGTAHGPTTRPEIKC